VAIARERTRADRLPGVEQSRDRVHQHLARAQAAPQLGEGRVDRLLEPQPLERDERFDLSPGSQDRQHRPERDEPDQDPSHSAERQELGSMLHRSHSPISCLSIPPARGLEEPVANINACEPSATDLLTASLTLPVMRISRRLTV
jgi:hypothetical protein